MASVSLIASLYPKSYVSHIARAICFADCFLEAMVLFISCSADFLSLL